MNIKSQKDFFSGLMFMCVGVAFAWGASTYTIGNGARMGPGYFPFYLGILMTLLGLLVLVKSMGAKAAIESIPKFNWKIMAQITGAVVLYGLLLPKMGFLVAVVVLVFVLGFVLSKKYSQFVIQSV